MLHTKETTVTERRHWSGTKRRSGTIDVVERAKAAGNRYSYGFVAMPEQAPSSMPSRRTTTAPNSRLARSEGKLITAAIGIASCFCASLILYLCSYAQISSLGMREAASRVQLRETQEKNEFLLAQYNALRSPQRIVPAALALKMQNVAPTATYIDLSRAPAPSNAGVNQSTAGPQLTASAAGSNHDTSIGLSNAVKAADSGTTGENKAATGDF